MDVNWEFTDNSGTITDAFADFDSVNQVQLYRELDDAGLEITGIVYSDDSLWLTMDESYSSEKRSTVELVVANHVPVEYETRTHVMYSGSTNGSGLLTITFDKPYRIVPEIFVEAVLDESYKNILVSRSTTGCVCKVVRNQAVSAALISLNVLTAPVAVSSAHITIDVRQSPENL